MCFQVTSLAHYSSSQKMPPHMAQDSLRYWPRLSPPLYSPLFTAMFVYGRINAAISLAPWKALTMRTMMISRILRTHSSDTHYNRRAPVEWTCLASWLGYEIHVASRSSRIASNPALSVDTVVEIADDFTTRCNQGFNVPTEYAARSRRFISFHIQAMVLLSPVGVERGWES